MPIFSLETALKVRKRLEKFYQKALADEVQAEQQYNEKLDLMSSALDVHNKDLDVAKESGLTISQLILGGHFKQRIDQQMELIKYQMKEQQEVVDLKRHELTLATQKKRVLEILKDKENKKYIDEMERLERLEADEIAQNYSRHAKN
mgnify:CR=1 FL=1